MRKFFLFMLLIMMIATINAAPPASLFQTSDNGLIIEYPKFTSVPKDHSFTLHTHVINSSNGLNVYNYASCLLHLYNISGSHVLEMPMAKDDNGVDFELFISAPNFSSIGRYSYIINCNDSTHGGFSSGVFYITEQGDDEAGDNFIIFIYVFFFITMAYLLVKLVMNVVRIVTASETLFGVLTSWVSYLALIMTNFLGSSYIINPFVRNITSSLILAFGFTHVLLPMFALIITMFYKSTQKKSNLSPEEMTGGISRYG